MDLVILYKPDEITHEQLLATLRAAGSGVGIGEWRQEAAGMYGSFQVVEHTVRRCKPEQHYLFDFERAKETADGKNP